MTDKVDISWMSAPEDHDYPAAESYLKLLFEEAKAAGYIGQLHKAQVTGFKAKDILRASGLALLGAGNAHVDKDRKKILAGIKLSPLLLVRQPGVKVIVADGYHRLCAVYGFDEDALIPCKIV
ncbi:MAG: hypothetical protein GAK35_02479 [Herbaspirillum frisingense]|uniref:Uncharacterized protein n=1 Tax=Herbaspirillum frisingense TaxID=92645 RepID=A0A7V8JTZ7_9BURK|nr:MAG: hypothetical protein GAK35_02479 [Herbaspirillum frisingense]